MKKTAVSFDVRVESVAILELSYENNRRSRFAPKYLVLYLVLLQENNLILNA